MNAKYYALCQEYYEKVSKKIKEDTTTEQAKKIFDNFMLKIVPDYFEEDSKVETIDFEEV